MYENGEHEINNQTRIKVVDLFSPYQHGGKIGLFEEAGVGKIIFIMELINIIVKAHEGFL